MALRAHLAARYGAVTMLDEHWAHRLLSTLRANIPETPVVLLINEQGEKEKGRDGWEFFWCSFSRGFGWRGTERRRAKRAEYVEHE
jgi:hypothetical protein